MIVDLCQFVPTPDGRWRCAKCGHLSPVSPRAPWRLCRVSGLRELRPSQQRAVGAAVTPPCVHRVPDAVRLTERFGCGCHKVVVHVCRLYGEHVTLRRPPERGRKTLTAEWDDYRGRDCASCAARRAPPDG